MKFYLFANSTVSQNIPSGGDKRFIEITKEWLKEDHDITVMVSKNGYELYKKQGLKANFDTLSSIDKFGIIPSYISRLINALFKVPKTSKDTILISTSDFLPDVMPAMMTKRENGNRWIAMIFHLIPKPRERKGSYFNNLTSYLAQKISLRIIKKNADFVFVDNKLLKDDLIRLGFEKEKIIVVDNGMNYNLIKSIPASKEKYDATFLGRLHPQKGVFDLIKIWEEVVKKFETAKLALIGGYSSDIKNKLEIEIKNNSLEKNVKILGFLPTNKALSLIKASKLFLFPSHEEGWGISIAEAMACRKPVIAYDLPVYKEIFESNIIKVPLKDINAFAKQILRLLQKKDLRDKISAKASNFIKKYDWKRIAEDEIKTIKSIIKA